jgi:hypothetical protein
MKYLGGGGRRPPLKKNGFRVRFFCIFYDVFQNCPPLLFEL